ncbi:FAD-binding oxidoreductase [Actinomadura craniellae]|uniref:FAD-binding oxidoreductase n=1 Tax=Actinomadura craniellae TaxID=2231787 RepID=A0A365H0Y5_9ACTN|nr:FAD-binding oxidoreductase [Actinomadura craniellae]RAY11853.1 FAD-binding oxidoreductase [Actinomadura craniellae]
MQNDPLAARLAEVVGAAHVLTDPALTASYTTDFTRRFGGPARLVVRPGDTGQVASVVRICAAEGVPVVPQGGNTGLAGGGVPRSGEVLLSLRRLDGLGPVDGTARQLTAGAGATLTAVQRHARTAGLDFGVDLAARDSATVGGMAATNAGGERVLRYGTMRANVAGLSAVLADGSAIDRLSGLPKDNAGYDLTGLLVGSEGTLGIVTALRLRLVPRPPERTTALLAFGSLADAVASLDALRSLDSLELAEFFLPTGLALVREHTGLPAPFTEPHGAYVLVEYAAPAPPVLDLLADLERLRDAVVAADSADRHRLATYREAHTEAISAAGVPVKLDVTVPLPDLAGFVTEMESLPATPYLFGHLAEGNAHVNLLGAADPEAVTETVLRRVGRAGGSISAEHGIGTAKVPWLDLTRSPTEIAAMRAVKRALDPYGLLNPGVLFPARPSGQG